MTLLLGESFQFNKEQFFGDLLGVLTAVWYGSYIISISQLRRKYNTTSIMFISGVITSIILIIISIIFEQQLIPQTINSIIVLFLLAFVCQFLGQAFIAYALAIYQHHIIAHIINSAYSCYDSWLFIFSRKTQFIQFLGCILI